MCRHPHDRVFIFQPVNQGRHDLLLRQLRTETHRPVRLIAGSSIPLNFFVKLQPAIPQRGKCQGARCADGPMLVSHGRGLMPCRSRTGSFGNASGLILQVRIAPWPVEECARRAGWVPVPSRRGRHYLKSAIDLKTNQFSPIPPDPPKPLGRWRMGRSFGVPRRDSNRRGCVEDQPVPRFGRRAGRVSRTLPGRGRARLTCVVECFGEP